MTNNGGEDLTFEIFEGDGFGTAGDRVSLPTGADRASGEVASGDPAPATVEAAPRPFAETELEEGFDDVVLKGTLEDDDEASWWNAWKDHVRSDALLKPWEGRGRARKRRKVVKDEVDEPQGVPTAPSMFEAYKSVDEFEEDDDEVHVSSEGRGVTVHELSKEGRVSSKGL